MDRDPEVEAADSHQRTMAVHLEDGARPPHLAVDEAHLSLAEGPPAGATAGALTNGRAWGVVRVRVDPEEQVPDRVVALAVAATLRLDTHQTSWTNSSKSGVASTGAAIALHLPAVD